MSDDRVFIKCAWRLIPFMALLYLLVGYGPYYCLLASLSSGKTSAAGIALANALNVVGAFFGPTIIGVLRDATGGYAAAMAVLAAGCIVSALVFIGMGPALGVQPTPKASTT